MTTIEASFAACREITRRTAGNFHWSFLTLPRAQYNAMCALYAFMRKSDDLADDSQVELAQRRRDLEKWSAQLKESLAAPGLSQVLAADVTFPALAETVRRYAIPPQYLHEVLVGVASDLEPRRFRTFAEIERYCYLVAGAVGLCCIHIWGFRGEDCRELAIRCGTAFQLTNILRDVHEDWCAGRVYIADDDWRAAGLTPEEFFREPRSRRAKALLAALGDRTQEYYRGAAPLLDRLSPAGRRILRAMMSIYGELLHEMRCRDYDVCGGRVSLPAWRKGWLLAESLAGVTPRMIRHSPR